MTTKNYVYGNGTTIAGRKTYRRPQAMLWSDNPPIISSGVYVPSGNENQSVALITAVNDASPGAGTVEYTAANDFSIGDSVSISGFSIAGFNGTFTVTAATSTYFRVLNSTTGSPTLTNAKAVPLGEFLILSDHNRKDISFKTQRIEKRERMINGRMRSYHIADKMTISTSWDMLPSRAFSVNPQFDVTTGLPTATVNFDGMRNSGGTITYDADRKYTVDGGAGGNELLDWYNNHTGSFYVFLAYDRKSNFAETGQYSHLAEYNEVIEMFISSFDYTVVKRGGSNFDFWNISVTLEEV
jgi:hypothetical protein